jgi:hypothetical protein
MKKWFVGLCIAGAVSILFGCETNPTDDCGGLDNTVSCVSVTNISPMDSAGEVTSDVDAVQDACEVDNEDGATVEPEPFTAHIADITFENSQFTTASDSFDVTVRRFSVSYELANCPVQATGCPPLTGFEGAQTFVIPQNGQVTRTFPLVPLAVKDEYVAAGGEVSGSGTGAPFPTYTARYVFRATTEPFSTGIEIVATQDFTIGNFNNCP